MRRWLKRPAGLGALAILLPPDGRRAGGLDFERLALAERFGALLHPKLRSRWRRALWQRPRMLAPSRQVFGDGGFELSFARVD